MKKLKFLLVLAMFAPLPIALLAHVAQASLVAAVALGAAALALVWAWSRTTAKEAAQSLRDAEEYRRKTEEEFQTSYVVQQIDQR